LNVIDNPEDPPNSESVIPMRLQYIVDSLTCIIVTIDLLSFEREVSPQIPTM